jgi:putative salt-induced outer membrane protein YdiY
VIAPAEIAAAAEATKTRAWKGKVDLNSSVSRGNTESHLVNLQGDLQVTKGDHRYRGDISAIREEVDGVTKKEQDRLNLGYNYLFKDGVLDNWFLAVNATIERDPVALLDQRYSLNPSLGYDFWDEPNRQLSVQLGAGYADEETNNQNESSTLVDWRLDFSYDLMAGEIELFHNHHIYRNLNGRENTVFNSKTGVRYDITNDIYLNVQVNYDYDTEPAAGTDSKDVTFLVGAGVDL